MPPPKFVPLELVSIRNHPDLNEKWVQARIAEDPSILGLGDLLLRDAERIQPHAGRLDLLLEDLEMQRRYEVELQLGETDASHIIRTIEYWDIERKRSPRYKHCGVIIAENVTSRFLNVIGLFNGAIPLIAIQFRAVKNSDGFGSIFTTIVGENEPSIVEEEELNADRAYWEKRTSKETIAIADEVLEIIKSFSPEVSWRYKKAHIGITEGGQVNNFAWCFPLKTRLGLGFKVEQAPEVKRSLEEAGLDMMPYDLQQGAYRVRLTMGDVQKNRGLLASMLKAARERYSA